MTTKLDQIASVRTLTTFRDRAPAEAADGNACVLSIRDLVSRWPVDFTTLPRVDVGDAPMAEYLEPGDILLPGRGASYPARLFDGAPLPVLTAGQVFVIRVHKKLDAVYLCWYLNRPEVQAEITQLLAGSAIQALNKSSLLKLAVVVPDGEVQKHIAELQSLADERRGLREELESLERAVIEHACEALIRPRGSHG